MFDLVRSSPNTVALSRAVVFKEIRLKSIDSEFVRSVTPDLLKRVIAEKSTRITSIWFESINFDRQREERISLSELVTINW